MDGLNFIDIIIIILLKYHRLPFPFLLLHVCACVLVCMSLWRSKEDTWCPLRWSLTEPVIRPAASPKDLISTSHCAGLPGHQMAEPLLLLFTVLVLQALKWPRPGVFVAVRDLNSGLQVCTWFFTNWAFLLAPDFFLTHHFISDSYQAKIKVGEIYLLIKMHLFV